MLFGKRKVPVNEIFSEGFIDIHSHLLPGIDDGSKDLENSIELIEKLRELGIKKLITTPHTMTDVYPNNPIIINEQLEVVQQELKVRGIKDVEISAASEYLIDHDFLNKLQQKEILSFGKKNYVLVEMSFFNPPNNLKEVLFQMQVQGYKPIMAHPERYNFYKGEVETFKELKELGCSFQLNLLSLTPQYGKHVQKTSYKLLEKGLYDFVGTDTHHTGHTALLNTIATKKNKKWLQPLIENNKNILD